MNSEGFAIHATCWPGTLIYILKSIAIVRPFPQVNGELLLLPCSWLLLLLSVLQEDVPCLAVLHSFFLILPQGIEIGQAGFQSWNWLQLYLILYQYFQSIDLKSPGVSH